VVARKLWLRQNKVVHGGLFTHPTVVWREVETTSEDFQRLNLQQGSQSSIPHEAEVEKWQAPLEGFVKYNWDAAIDKKKKTIGMGIIARDSNGHFLTAFSKQQQMDVDPITAEALAALYAILFCHE
jgi:hypothetical protein